MARPEKVAKVDEIKDRITSAGAAVLTEYRGLTVTEIARLRAALRDTATTYKIYKNTLARRAAEAAELPEVVDLLTGPTAWAFVDGDVASAAKALKDFARTNDALVLKGGLLEGRFISADQVDELASLPARPELLAKMAGTFKAPMYKAASLFSALQRNTAYAIKALIDKRVEGGEELPVEAEAEVSAPAAEAEAEVSAPAAEGSEEVSEASASHESGEPPEEAEVAHEESQSDAETAE